MTVKKSWLVPEVRKMVEKEEGEGAAEKWNKAAWSLAFVVFINVNWHWMMDEFQKPQNPKNA